MNLETLRGVLLWSGLINYGFLAFWSLLMLFAHRRFEWIARLYGVSIDDFNRIQLLGLLFYKVSIFLFFLIPYVALRIVAG